LPSLTKPLVAMSAPMNRLLKVRGICHPFLRVSKKRLAESSVKISMRVRPLPRPRRLLTAQSNPRSTKRISKMQVIDVLKEKLDEIDKAIEKLLPKLEQLKTQREHVMGTIESLGGQQSKTAPAKKPTGPTPYESEAPAAAKPKVTRKRSIDLEPWIIAALRQGAETLGEIKETFPKGSKANDSSFRNTITRLLSNGALTELEKGSGRKGSRYALSAETHASINGRLAAA
jgi:hypothetical protein